MMEDPNVMRPGRREWAVSFNVSAVFLGCLVTALVFMALTYVILATAPDEALPDDASGGALLRLALLIGGLAALAFLVIGPTVAYGLGWLLRNVRN